ncbi:hypothetical protein BRCON_2773 [Candidatus Sumerlaea chitinivorans]|uniref:Large extracellular alpha-helical protein n=1 Tax=Sumerlaea chitinivorans TaxID=2250252 RepID=A0A2Z4YAW8_SUMC1|nr:hypothetical protein BRCON_2773 [Candidatus Sumerlaea chitinivorans]
MVAFEPTGMLPITDSAVTKTIRVRFSSDIAKSLRTASSQTTQPVLLFSPSLAGRGRWATPREYIFTPLESLRPATEYVIRVNPLLRDEQGRTLSGATEFRFSTPALSLLGAHQLSFDPQRGVVLELRFSDLVAPEELEKYLSVETWRGQANWRFTAAEATPRTSQAAEALVVRGKATRTPRIIVSDVLTTNSLLIRIERGLRGASGPMPLPETIVREIPLYVEFAPLSIAADWEKEKARMLIRLSAVPVGEGIAKFVTVDPPLPFTAAVGGRTVILRGDFQPNTRYTVTLHAGLRSVSGQRLKSPAKLSVWVPPVRPFVAFDRVGGHLSPRGTMNLRVRSAAISEVHLTAWRLFENNLVYATNQYGMDRLIQELGEPVGKKTLTPEVTQNAVTTVVSLRELLQESQTTCGVFLVEVEAATRPEAQEDEYFDEEGCYLGWYGDRYSDRAVLCVSNLGLIAKRGPAHIWVWAGELDSARPIENASVQVWSDKNQLLAEGRTDANGLFVEPLHVSDSSRQDPAIVVVRKATDLTYVDLRTPLPLPEGLPNSDHAFFSRGFEAFLTPDRGVYRPNETVHFAGILRAVGLQPLAQPFPLELVLRRPDGRMLPPQIVTPTPSGTFEAQWKIQSNFPTGYYRATLRLPGPLEPREGSRDRRGMSSDSQLTKVGETGFYVEEFMPSRMELATSAPERRFAAKSRIPVFVRASELFGQPAAGRPLSVSVLYRPVPFEAPAFVGFQFGDPDIKLDRTEDTLEELMVGEDGTAKIEVPVPAMRAPAAISAEIQITVRDHSGRTLTQRLSRTLDPVPYYIGVRPSRENIVPVGEPLRFDIVTVRPEGTLAEVPSLEATVARVRWNSIVRMEGDRYNFTTTRELDPVATATIRLTNGRGLFEWTPADGGEYLLTVRSADGPQTAVRFFASSGSWEFQPWSMEKPEAVELVLDRNEYGVGDVAHLLVKSPFAGTVILTLEQDRVLSTTVTQTPQNTAEFFLPITEELRPNAYVTVSVLRPVKPAEKWLPHRAFGVANLRISARDRELAVVWRAPSEIRPNSPLTAEVQVVDAHTSKPVAADLALWAVDEGVLGVTAFSTPNPLDYFYGVRRWGVETADFYSELMPDLVQPAKASSAPGGDEGGMERRLSPVAAERVKPVALWLGWLTADANGRGRGVFQVPQYTGKLRLMAMAASQNRFGAAETPVYVRQPLMLEERLPRFLAPSDRATVPLVVFNNSDDTTHVRVRVEVAGPIAVAEETASGSSQEIREKILFEGEIPARGSRSLPLTLQAAAATVGVAHIRITAQSDGESCETRVELPVRPAAAWSRFTGTEKISAGERVTLRLPTEFLAGTTTATLVVSGRPSAQLLAAARFNTHYPYGCLEQVVSAAFPLLYLNEIQQASLSHAETTRGMALKVQAVMEQLAAMQTPAGGLAMWPGGRKPWTWGSIYAAHFLVEAQRAGFDVWPEQLELLLDWISKRVLLFAQMDKLSDSQLTERAYATLVMARAGRNVRDHMELLYDVRNRLSSSARALLASAYLSMGSVSEADTLLGMAEIGSERRDRGLLLSSPVRETAILLAASTERDPASPQGVALANRLLGMRRPDLGHWGTTQDNAFALWALGKYFGSAKQADADAHGAVEWGEGNRVQFTTTNPAVLTLQSPDQPITIQNTGRGVAYASWVVEGVPAKPDLQAKSRGLQLTRKLLSRSGKPLETANLTQGQLIIVELALKGGSVPLPNVVIEDLLPACLEIENPNLASTEQAGETDSFEGAKLPVTRWDARDDRMIVFADLPGGEEGKEYVFRYACRVVSAGEFVQPPAYATCMYDADVSAQTEAGSLTVRPR